MYAIVTLFHCVFIGLSNTVGKQQMIDRMLEQRRAINRVLSDDRKADNVTIDWQTHGVLESMNKALKPVSEFTDVLSSENCITASALLPVLELIKEETLGPSDDDTTLTASFKAGIVTILREKYEAPTLPEGSRDLLRKATFMDPRYKGGYDSDVRETKRMIQEDAVTIGRQRAVNTQHMHCKSTPIGIV